MARLDEEVEDAQQRIAARDETAPLLGRPDNGHICDEQQDNARSRFFAKPVSVLSLAAYVCFCICMEFGTYMSSAPLHQVLEGIICDRRSLRAGDHNDCKDRETQGQLTTLLGWYQTFLLIPSLLLVLPYGLLADRYSQKLILVLGAVGILLTNAWVRIVCWFPDTFNERWVWAAPFFTLIGGGGTSINAILYANVTDLTTDRSRTTAFSTLMAISLVARLLAMLTSATLLLHHSPWIPLGLGLVAEVGVIFFALLLPVSTSPRNPRPADEEGEARSSLINSIRGGLKGTASGLSFLARASWTTIRLVLCFTAISFAWQCSRIIPLYAYYKLDWSWSETGFLSSLDTAVSIAATLAFLPALSQWMSTKLSMSTMKRDMTIVRICCCLLIAGAALMMVANGTVIMVLGDSVWTLATVYTVVLKNLLVLSVGESSTVLFSCINMLELVSAVVSGPLVAKAFMLGLDLGEVGLRLPFIIASGFAAVALALCFGSYAALDT